MGIIYFGFGVICELFAFALTCFSIYCVYYTVFSVTDWYDGTWRLCAWKWLCRFLFFPIVLFFIMYIARFPIFFAFGAGVAFFTAGVH